jgi:transposase
MDHIGIDVHKRESQICMLAEGGALIEQRIRTEPERFAAVLGTRPRARIVIEASTDSEWVAPCLEGLGHEVIVADPNFSPMYATRTRRIKTDRRDARALADANLLGTYRPAHRLSDPQRRHPTTHHAVRGVVDVVDDLRPLCAGLIAPCVAVHLVAERRAHEDPLLDVRAPVRPAGLGREGLRDARHARRKPRRPARHERRARDGVGDVVVLALAT